MESLSNTYGLFDCDARYYSWLRTVIYPWVSSFKAKIWPSKICLKLTKQQQKERCWKCGLTFLKSCNIFLKLKRNHWHGSSIFGFLVYLAQHTFKIEFFSTIFSKINIPRLGAICKYVSRSSLDTKDPLRVLNSLGLPRCGTRFSSFCINIWTYIQKHKKVIFGF